MKQRQLHILVVLFAMLLPCAAWADLKVGDTFETDGITYQVTSTSPKEVQVGTGTENPAINLETEGAIEIPSMVTDSEGKEYIVTKIAVWAFLSCKGLTSVTIPNSVTTIEFGAFEYCIGLTSIRIPLSVTNIESGAFYGCQELNSIEVEIGNTVYDSRNNCNAIIKTETNELIEGSNSTVIPNTVTSIGKNAFCKRRIHLISIPNSVTSIGDYAFNNCFTLGSIVIPNSVVSIGKRAFADCALTEVTIGKSVKSIGKEAFDGSAYIHDVYSLIEEPFAIDKSTFTDRVKEQKRLNVPAGTKAKYEATEGWKEFKNIVEMESGAKELAVGDTFEADGITYKVTSTSPREVMVGYKEPESYVAINKETTGFIEIPSSVAGPDANSYSVTEIQEDAFENCSKLTGVSIPENVTKIGVGAFRGCISLSSINIPKTVTQIGSGAFDGCEKLESIIIPMGITTIERATFQNCESLTNIIFPSTLSIIKDHAFNNCGSLTNIRLPEGVTSIGDVAFGNCWNMESITIPSTVTSIGKIAFGRNSRYSSITSYMTVPSPININTFNDAVYSSATLYVPAGTKAKYEATDGWKEFKNIVEMQTELNPIDGETTVKTEELSGQDLSNNVVNDVYYNTGENSYDSSDGSIVISQTTNMSQIADKQPGSADVKENFNGMILKVAKGKGLITVNAKTSGNAQLVVQVGNGTPMLASKTEKGDVVFSYDVEEDTYVYIYAIIGSSAAKGYGLSAADTESSVRIYSITVSPGATGIRSIGASEKNDGNIYDLQGHRVETPAKGIYIIGGRKVAVK